jgi:hypothetical protein
MNPRAFVPLLSFVAACTPDPPPAPTAPTSATREATPAAPPTASPDATPDPPPTHVQASALPPLDARCTSDSDCAVTPVVLESGATQCCNGCAQTTAGSVAWVAEVSRACEKLKREQHKMCPMRACPGNIRNAECKQGTCVLKR